MEKGRVKLNDFSLSRFTLSKSTRIAYTSRYRAPEVVIGKTSLKSDVYALGCTMYEIYYNTVYDRWSFTFNIAHHQLPFLDLIYNMTLSDPNERYSIEDVKRHQFFENVKFVSYNPLNIDIIQSLEKRWPWEDADVFLSKCMHEEIPHQANHTTVDRRTCDILKFKLLDNF